MSGAPDGRAEPRPEAVLAALRRAREADLLGPAPVEDHLSHALAYAGGVPEAPGHAVDLGSGGGVPGLVLAALTWPECRWTLVDASAKRCRFLDDRVADLGLGGRVDVVHARAEELGRTELREAVDLVVARSFGPPPVLAECAAPLLRLGGTLVVSEPPTGSPEGRWPTEPLADLGLGSATLVVPAPRLVALVKQRTTPARYPRRPGIPAKRPLYETDEPNRST